MEGRQARFPEESCAVKQGTVSPEGAETIFYLLDCYMPKTEETNVPKLVLLVMLKDRYVFSDR